MTDSTPPRTKDQGAAYCRCNPTESNGGSATWCERCERLKGFAAGPPLALSAASVNPLAILDRIFVEELNGRLCPIPDHEDARCCPRCRETWALVAEALGFPDSAAAYRKVPVPK